MQTGLPHIGHDKTVKYYTLKRKGKKDQQGSCRNLDMDLFIFPKAPILIHLLTEAYPSEIIFESYSQQPPHFGHRSSLLKWQQLCSQFLSISGTREEATRHTHNK